MAFLVDTNVISELRGGSTRCHPGVWQWYDGTPMEEIYLSVLVLGEMRKGVELKRARDPMAAHAFERWLRSITTLHRPRILEVTREIADLWGILQARVQVPITDGLLAATAQCHRLTVVTRNARDFQRCAVDFINPFEF